MRPVGGAPRHRLPFAAAFALVAWLAAPGVHAADLAAPATDTTLTTRGESTGYRETGRYEEVVRLCRAFAARWPGRVRCVEFGRTPEGRAMLALVASATGALEPAAAHARGLPVLLFQGGIHAGEIDGKDAGFSALQALLEGRELPGALERTVVVFVPVFNVDGHERFGRWNRPNQRGPEEMGWRTTARNLNLNRDYAKAEAPEMRAMLGLLAAWDPILYADLHVTDGAQFRVDLSVEVEPGDGWEPGLARTGHSIRDAVLEQLRAQGFIALPFYPSFVTEDEPDSGFAVGVSDPRYQLSYWATRNRFAALVETHSWKPYARRVEATRATVLAMIDLASRDGQKWLAEARAADARTSQLAGRPVVLQYQSGSKARTIEFPGYAYSREPSAVSGQPWIRYDESTPQVWRVPLRDEVEPKLTITAPAQGYVVPAAHAAWVARELDLHGIRYETLQEPRSRLAVQTFRAADVQLGSKIEEGSVHVTVTGAWADDTRDVPAGSLFVPIAQPEALLVMSLLEPEAPDSYVSWGRFNAAWEQKEYMEAYVTEAVAREMLAGDPALAAEFERRLREDAAFAASPRARLDFFYQRHPSWDDRYRLYPVYRR
jgi:hypothetical protein